MSCALSYNLSVTGDCTNSGLGAYSIQIYGSAPDYSIQYVYPQSGVSGFTYTGTSFGFTTTLWSDISSSTVIGSGSGAKFNVIQNSPSPSSYDILLSNPGVGYQIGDILKINGSDVGGSSLNDINLTITSLQDSGAIALSPGNTTYTLTNLSAGTYTINLIDSCIPENNVLPIDIYISSGTGVNILGIKDTLCNLPNGAVTASTSNFYGVADFKLYKQDGTYVISASLFDDQYVFTDLEAGYYYVVANDGGGCTGQSATFLVMSSQTVDYGFYVIDNGSCGNSNIGAVYITGLTGTPPYTYSWNNGESTQSITGLSSGEYIVTVEDSVGCIKTLTANVLDVESLSFGSFNFLPPNCFTADGEITINVIGGTPPYSYLGSNGVNAVSFAQTYTFTGLGSGNFTVTVTDAGLCSFSQSIPLLTPNSFSLVNFNTKNSFCNDSSGELTISLIGGSAPYSFTVTDISGNTYNKVSTTPNVTFTGLKSGTYTLQINDSGVGTCTFYDNFTINNTSKFELSASTVGSLCDSAEGEVTLTISTGGTEPYTYEIDDQFVVITGLTHTFTGLTPGNYTALVTDSTNCGQSVNFTVVSTNSVDFTLVPTSATLGNNGTITALITDGTPPFILDWSPNVNGQTGLTITNLTAGTYSLEVTDSSGCTKTEIIIVNGLNNVVSYEIFNVCDINLDDNGFVLVKGPKSLLIEGFNDLTSGDTDCIINETVFVAQTNINGDIRQKYFYSGISTTDYPPNNLWYDTITELLLSYNGIQTVDIDGENNTIEVKNDCEDIASNLSGAQVIVDMIIKYNISCVSCD